MFDETCKNQATEEGIFIDDFQLFYERKLNVETSLELH